MKSLLFFLFLPLIFYSCTEDSVSPDVNPELIGTWIYESQDNEIVTMKKSYGFESQNSGFRFDADNHFIERKVSGSCGTPPVIFENYEGTWEQSADNKLKIVVGFWGGVEEKNLEIISLTSSVLQYKYLSVKIL